MKTYAMRLTQDQDLKKELVRFTHENNIQAGIILTTVGSLKRAMIRYAGDNDASQIDGKLEILSVVGTLCQDGVHLHIAVADHKGTTFGGHLMDGCLVRTTAEIVIANLGDFHFTREFDPNTGYPELVVRQ